MSPLAWTGFVVAAAIGAPMRYAVDTFVGNRTEGVFPWGTFLINASGSFALGVLTGLSLYHAFPRTPRLVLGTGFCGAYTTFSTFTFETMQLVEAGALREAMTNALATLVTCAAAAGVGLAVATL